MKKLTMLTVHSRSRAKVRVWADAVLYVPASGYGGRRFESSSTYRYMADATLYAFSIIGPEQAVRAIASGCAVSSKFSREVLTFTGPEDKIIEGKWGPGWNCQARMLCAGVMHMVALPIVETKQTTVGDEQANLGSEHVIVAVPVKPGLPTTTMDLRRAIYQRLLLCYTTPLIPLGVPGQPETERRAAADWCLALTEAIMEDSSMWQPLKPHPEQTDSHWTHAGVLTLLECQLDNLVCALVKAQRLRLPAEAA